MRPVGKNKPVYKPGCLVGFCVEFMLNVNSMFCAKQSNDVFKQWSYLDEIRPF